MLLSLLFDLTHGRAVGPNKIAILRAAVLKRHDLYRPFDLSAAILSRNLEVRTWTDPCVLCHRRVVTFLGLSRLLLLLLVFPAVALDLAAGAPWRDLTCY